MTQRAADKSDGNSEALYISKAFRSLKCAETSISLTYFFSPLRNEFIPSVAKSITTDDSKPTLSMGIASIKVMTHTQE